MSDPFGMYYFECKICKTKKIPGDGMKRKYQWKPNYTHPSKSSLPQLFVFIRINELVLF